MFEISIPTGAKKIISLLQSNGYAAYVVGGCVRDSLLGFEPKDWDICTSATPEEVKHCLSNRTIDTGLKHGTITVISDDDNYEVTTYRVDGNYSDNRHPDKVKFVTSLTEDLARRDFTINAMAYNDTDGLVDKFGGITDLEHKRISCVGKPDDRFAEDALRILRAMRFASTYGFSIQQQTAESIHRNKKRLDNIAYERIQTELIRMLHGSGILQILLDFSDVISTIIPELKPCVGFDQNNRYHQYDIYEHISHAVSNYTGDDAPVKIALLLHDIGKPLCYTEDEKGGHFYGHALPSRDLARVVLDRLRFDNKTKAEVLELVLYHDSVIEATPKTIRRWLAKIGEQRLRQLIAVKKADIAAHKIGTYEERLAKCDVLLSIVDEVIDKQQCFSIKNLSINGNYIIKLGIPEGVAVGRVLRTLLDMVIAGEIVNETDILKRWVSENEQRTEKSFCKES